MAPVAVVGAGINGLVAAFYLRKAGHDVVLFERNKIGGACSAAAITIGRHTIRYQEGASVFGMMPRTIFEELGLHKHLTLYVSDQPDVVHFPKCAPVLMYADIHKRMEEMKEWGEPGGYEVDFMYDCERIARWLNSLHKQRIVPTYKMVRQTFDDRILNNWFIGSAKHLVDRTLSTEQAKMYHLLPVIESGMVDIDAPTTAFTIPLMASGDVCGLGRWGWVRGGISQIAVVLERILMQMGVQIICAQVTNVPEGTNVLDYMDRTGEFFRMLTKAVVFATDPYTAAVATESDRLLEIVKKKEMRGSAGKQVFFFDNPVEWKDAPGANTAMRFIFTHSNVESLVDGMRLVKTGKERWRPNVFQIYPDGAAERAALMEAQSWDEFPQRQDHFSVFFKDIALSLNNEDKADIKKQVELRILSLIENTSSFMGSVLFTPKDLQTRFLFPEGNIDHIELTCGQNYVQRTFSDDPTKSFYRFGSHRDTYYCGAGAYPCGSVSGVPGFFCAKEVIAQLER